MVTNGTAQTGASANTRPVSDLSYTEASRELDAIVAFFEQRDVDVDQLVGRLERATAIVGELDKRLRRTRIQVEQLVPRLAAVLAEDGDQGEALESGEDGEDGQSVPAAADGNADDADDATPYDTAMHDAESHDTEPARQQSGEYDDGEETELLAVTEVVAARSRPRRRSPGAAGGPTDAGPDDGTPGLF